MTEDKRDDIIALRELGLTPKVIARRLGVRPAEVSAVIRRHAVKVHPRHAAAEWPLHACLVSPGWSIDLGLGEEARQWPDVACADESEAQGLITVVVARRNRYHKLAYCVYLVDAFCMGVKDADGPHIATEEQLEDRVRDYFANYPQPPIDAPLELARCLVLGAADYAASLGFSPHRDFAAARPFLGAWSGACPITFGRKGRPFYVSGPHDDPDQVLDTLDRTVGKGNFECLILSS